MLPGFAYASWKQESATSGGEASPEVKDKADKGQRGNEGARRQGVGEAMRPGGRGREGKAKDCNKAAGAGPKAQGGKGPRRVHNPTPNPRQHEAMRYTSSAGAS